MAEQSPNELEQNPRHCPETRTGAHRWIRSAITGRADFCWKCEIDADAVREHREADL